MIKTTKPYGAINKELIQEVWTWKNKYFLRDKYGNVYQIDYKTYEEFWK